MAQRAALPEQVVTITPGYSWRLDLDIAFDGTRPEDWPSWIVRMHIWGAGISLTLENGAGVRFEPIADLPSSSGPVVLPVIEMSGEQTELLRASGLINYVIDLQAPDGDTEDYFAGSIQRVFSPPREMLA